MHETKFGLADVKKIQVRDYNFINCKSEQTGFIAQQLFEVFPEAVAVGGEDPKKRPWMVDYGRITPLLVKAVQELSAENEALKKRIDKIEQLLLVNSKTIKLSNAALGQSVPNPNSNSTKITYNIPGDAANAQLTIDDMAGKKIKEIQLSNNDNGVLNIDTSKLRAGTYSYSLFVDGKLIETKQMIVTK